MKKVYFNFAIFVCLLFISDKIFSQNLILNPGFEGSGSWLNNAFVSLSTEHHNGAYSAYMHVNGTDTSLLGQCVNGLIPGKTYMFEFWVKASNMSHYLLPFIRFTSDTGNIYDSYFCPNGNVNDWNKVISRFTTPPGADSAIFIFAMYQTGDVWLDDFSLVMQNDTAYHNFAIHADTIAGTFTDVFNANGIGPGDASQPFNHVNKFQEAGIRYVRTHDFATAFDYHVIFPDTSKSATDPTAYNFHTTDSCIANIINAGGFVYFRFGESYEIDHAHAVPPADKQKFADVCVQIIKHYNDGWNNGFHYGIDYFEIWNEPDLKDFWAGTVNEYIELYTATANAIKNYNSTLHVGGPAMSNIFDESFINSFLQSIVTNQTPLDFFSYHLYYFPNPYYFKVVNEYARHKLNEYTLNNIELINSEWNPYMFSFDTYSEWGMDDPLNAASTASALIYMQQSTIGKMFRYAFENYWFGIVDWLDNWRYAGYVFKAFHELSGNNIQIGVAGADTLGTTLIASRNIAGTNMYALISDNTSTSNGYHLQCTGLGNYSWHYTIYRIDATNRLDSVFTGFVYPGQTIISQQVQAPYVDYIVFDSPSAIQNAEINHFIVYPNPASDFIEIISEQPDFNVQISDITGKNLGLYSFENDKGKIDIHHLNNGIYLLKFNHDGAYTKVVVNK